MLFKLDSKDGAMSYQADYWDLSHKMFIKLDKYQRTTWRKWSEEGMCVGGFLFLMCLFLFLSILPIVACSVNVLCSFD